MVFILRVMGKTETFTNLYRGRAYIGMRASVISKSANNVGGNHDCRKCSDWCMRSCK